MKAALLPETEFAAVVFDAGGTLLGTNVSSPYWYEQFFADAAHELGYSGFSIDTIQTALDYACKQYQFENSFWQRDEKIFAYWRHVYSTVFRQICPTHDCEKLALRYIRRFESGDYSELFHDTLPTLKSLKALNVPLGIVSNFGSYLETILKKLGIYDYFSFIIISAKVGMSKPNTDIFKLAHSKLPRVEAREVLFVGDLIADDYEGSRQYGFTPLLIDRTDRHRDQTNLVRINTLADLEYYFNHV